jgi:hypothetical protein
VVRAGGELAGGDVVALHELLGEDLAAFQLGGGSGGANNLEAAGGELVGHALHQGQLRPHHG